MSTLSTVNNLKESLCHGHRPFHLPVDDTTSCSPRPRWPLVFRPSLALFQLASEPQVYSVNQVSYNTFNMGALLSSLLEIFYTKKLDIVVIGLENR